MDPVEKAVHEKRKLEKQDRDLRARERKREERNRKFQEIIESFSGSFFGSKPFLSFRSYCRFFLADYWIFNYTVVGLLSVLGIPTFYVTCVVPEFFHEPVVQFFFYLFPAMVLAEWFRYLNFHRRLKRIGFPIFGYDVLYRHDEFEYYKWFEIEVRISAVKNEAAIRALLESFCIRAKRFFYPHDIESADLRKSWKYGTLSVTGSANSRLILFLLRYLFLRLDQLNRFERSVGSVEVAILSGPVVAEARSNQSYD
ncbi:hypothetical protein EHQ12_06120 [Leptospira gomenensis]|uniref:Uncharacterized protein n=1 Tax=Leptospira gomenensis TaxID=2484974 RepID=A0A5F1Y8X3_9LEPT|nr:hypothetical protein [Leptospira gomenensis]TGK31820.1 hypothetical protein EHQ17_13705 [Leptospira gomenensis]TGK41553.1 hypothetical protein EHQ07_15775 [Leptospira gomenensis]TGK41718.1 hypothetical protein EHQ12_06120 [Leptospira gomenensis]TGK61489.1 hypothetical protein EHQ13_09095 [Leptospira gomenensis]